MSLTPKQERFCQEVAKNSSNASACYRLAYNCSNMKDETVNNNAYMLLKNSEIKARIEELRQPTIEKLNYNLETAVKELEEARLLAQHLNKPEAMINAIVGKAKLLGLGSEKNRETATTLINEQNNSQVNIVFTSKPQEVNDGE